jgi:TetR/AcrR family transcriptional regulator
VEGQGGRPPSEPHAKQTFFNLSEEKRRRIVEAATREFSEKGYARASINSIVGALGIAKGSIYQYFPDKKGLFLYTFEFAVRTVRATLKRVKAESAEADFFERVRRSLLAGFGFIRKHPRIYGAYLRVMFDSDAPMREELLRRIRLFSVDYLSGLAEEGLRRGELRQGFSPAEVAFFLDAVMDRMLQAYFVPGLDSGLGLHAAPQERLEQWVGLFVEMLRRGLGKEIPPQREG